MTERDYTLALSDAELDRYRRMAGYALEDEAADWASAGIGPGARVADVGCGPGAVLVQLARIVGPEGAADGVDGNEDAVAHARDELAGHPAGTVRVGRAQATGLEPGSYDVAMCRHVLAHNGGQEQAIVDHLVSLVRPGGAVVIVDVDLTSTVLIPDDPDLVLVHRYAEFHATQGNNPTAGLHLGIWLEAAGCTVERYHGVGRVQQLPLGLRPPPWAARDAMLASGLVTAEDVARTGAALDHLDTAEDRPWLAIAAFIAVGRVPGQRLPLRHGA